TGGLGVLGPIGWNCLGLYGSGGGPLVVTPQPIVGQPVFPEKFDDAAIVLDFTNGGGSGTYQVAEVVARVFPTYKNFALSVLNDGFVGPFSFGPYPNDTLAYKGKSTVEFRTPANTEGLGTHAWLKKNNRPIAGVAILDPKTFDLMQLSVRLPPGL